MVLSKASYMNGCFDGEPSRCLAVALIGQETKKSRKPEKENSQCVTNKRQLRTLRFSTGPLVSLSLLSTIFEVFYFPSEHVSLLRSTIHPEWKSLRGYHEPVFMTTASSIYFRTYEFTDSSFRDGMLESNKIDSCYSITPYPW